MLFVLPATAEGVTVTAYDTHDHAGAARVTLDGALAEPIGDADADAVRRTLRHASAVGATVLCAEAIGAMDVALWTTVDYLKTRRQFGVPLQTFQALQHRAADMFIEVEMARSIVAYATMALCEPEPDPLVVSRAKVQVGRSSRFVGQNAIQLHGGIGITDEHPIGHYAARLEAIGHAFGGAEHHLGALADALDSEATVELLA
jgi:alkylation response protein AidB-like acyl-CoA dehydrogenase